LCFVQSYPTLNLFDRKVGFLPLITALLLTSINERQTKVLKSCYPHQTIKDRLLPTLYCFMSLIRCRASSTDRSDVCRLYLHFRLQLTTGGKLRFISPVTRTNKKESFGSLFVLVFLHHFDLKKCLLKKLFPTVLTTFF